MDLEATPEERLQLEYATQHFGFTPDSFVETITTSAIDAINDGLDNTRKHLEKTFSGKVSKQELEESFAVIKNKYVTSAEKVLDNFSRYVKKNILVVPKNVVLPEDNVHVQKALKNDANINTAGEITQEKNLQETISDSELPSGEFFKGDNLIESIKEFERECQNTQNAKYKEAVLNAKLANLEIVALRQRRLLKKAEELAEARHHIETIVEGQEHVLDKKMNVLRELLHDNYQDQEGTSIQDGSSDDKKQIRQTDGSILAMSSTIPRNLQEKRALATAMYEEAVIAKKCRRFEEDDGYDVIHATKNSEEAVEQDENSPDNIRDQS